MSYGFLFGLIASLIAIGSIVVSVTTKINHIGHIKDCIKANKKAFDEHITKSDKNFTKIWDRLDEISDCVSFIKGKMNNN